MSKKRRNRSRTLKKRQSGFSRIDWERLGYWLYLSLALIVPFVLLEGFYNWVELPRGILIQVSAVFILLVWFAGAISRKELRIIRTPLDLPLLGFVSWAGLSLFWAHNFYEGFEIWMQWGACFICFFLTVNLVHSERDIRRLLSVLVLAGTLVAILGICQYLLSVNWVPQIIPPAATFANRNMAAQFMVMTIPLAVGFFLLSRKRVHVLLTVAALGVLILFLFYASTRSSWLAATVECLLLLVLLGRDHFKWKLAPPMEGNKKKILAGCVVVSFVLINLTPSGFQWQVGTAVDRIRQVLPGSSPEPLQVFEQGEEASLEDPSQVLPVRAEVPRTDSLSGRIRLWRNTLRMGTEHLVKGVGVGNFRVLYPRYARSTVVDPMFSVGGQWGRAHNDYAQTFAELGMVGLFFLGWLLFALIKTSIALLGEKRKGELRYLFMGVIVALLGLLVNAFFSFPFQMSAPTFIFAIYLGVLGGHYSRQSRQSEKSVLRRKLFLTFPSWTAAVGAAFTLVLLLILLPFEYNRLMADWYYNRVDVAFRNQIWTSVVPEARKGYRYYPYRKEFLFAEGRAHLEAGNADAAIEVTEEFLEDYPHSMNAHYNVALAYVRKGDMDLAFQHFDRVFEILPKYGPAHFEVAQLYARRNELDQALEHYRLAVQDEPQNALFLEQLGSAALAKELFSEAEEAFEKAVMKNPDNSEYSLKLGLAATQVGKFDKAMLAFSKAVELDPNSAEAHYGLGTLLLLVFEEKEEGTHHLKQVLNLGPSGSYADEARRLLENEGQ